VHGKPDGGQIVEGRRQIGVTQSVELNLLAGRQIGAILRLIGGDLSDNPQLGGLKNSPGNVKTQQRL